VNCIEVEYDYYCLPIGVEVWVLIDSFINIYYQYDRILCVINFIITVIDHSFYSIASFPVII